MIDLIVAKQEMFGRNYFDNATGAWPDYCLSILRKIFPDGVLGIDSTISK